jgi:CRISPR-associated protein Cmr1
VLGPDGKQQQQQIKKDGAFSLAFTPLRPIRSEEWTLLDATIRLIADYAAIGGKTVCKPSDENGRENEVHHRDYGIVSVTQSAGVEPVSLERMKQYVQDQRWRRVEHGAFAWASLLNFWSLEGKYLTRAGPATSSFNRVLGRKEDKSIKERNGRRVVRWSDLFVNKQDKASTWLAGGRGESKKVFSVKQPGRTFGFVKPGVVTLDDIRKRLETVWGSGSVSDDVLLTGSTVLDALWSREATP